MTKEAKPDVWFPLMVSSYLKKTMGLTTEQHGAYLLLLINYWVEGPPQDDDALLAGITRLGLAKWRHCRPVMLRYFEIVDGRWRQERADEELARWSERKRRYADRAAAGGRAKAARNPASSTPQALLNGCTSSSSREVDGPTGHSTLSGQNDFIGPKEVRDAFVTAKGEAWCASYLDPCGWQDVPDRALIPRTTTAAGKLIREARPILASLGLIVLERAA